MIDLKATNIKLQQRAKNILRFVGGNECTQSDEELEQILEACHGSVKLAAATIVLKAPVAEAEERLQRHKGVLAHVFQEEESFRQTNGHGKFASDLVLCVDAGGTSCKAVIMSPDGIKLLGVTGPCNV
jgi:N-acetylmuramic acid 6-phosphate etherase